MPSKVRSHQCYFFSNSHLCSSLLRNQLIPVQNDSFPDFAEMEGMDEFEDEGEQEVDSGVETDSSRVRDREIEE